MAVLVVFAGGRSSRFGRDKCTYVHKGRRLIDYVIDAASEAVDDVIVAAGRNAHLYPGHKVVEDSPRFSGPLAAVDAVVQRVNDTVLFAPCDIPYVQPAVFRELLRSEAPTSVWVFPNGRVESTIFKTEPAAVRGALNLLAQFGRSRLDDVFRLVTTEFLAVEKHGIDPAWLLNVNRPQDLAGGNPAFSRRVFLDDYLLSWEDPPLARWLRLRDGEALRRELLHYLETGLFSMAAHVAKDLATPCFSALAEVLHEAVDIRKW